MYYRVLAISLWQELCAYHIIVLQWKSSRDFHPSSHRQAIFGNVISRFSVFVFFVGLAYMQVFQVSPPLSYPENFPGYFTDVNRYLTYILFRDFSGHFLYFKSVIFCNLSSLYRSCEVHCNSSSQIINVI